ncbi:MAG: DUF4249 domain-containing protein [Bacteroidota bacterium]
MKSLLPILVLFVLTGCVEPFMFDSGDGDELLVIFGSVTPGNSASTLRITRTSAFGTGNLRTIDNAQVTLFDDQDASEAYVPLGNGRYRMNKNDIEVVAGRTYHIEVELNGNTYRSEPAVMPARVPADSTYFRVEEDILEDEDGLRREVFFIKLFVDTPVNLEQTSFLRWTMDEMFQVVLSPCPIETCCVCYYEPREINTSFILFDGSGTGTQQISGLELMRKQPLPHYEYQIRHYFNVYQHILTEDALRYWERIDIINNQEGTIFDPIPASIPGNISNVDNANEQVLGYFQVMDIDTVRTFATRSRLLPHQVLLERSLEPCPGFDSTVWDRPSYWGE